MPFGGCFRPTAYLTEILRADEQGVLLAEELPDVWDAGLEKFGRRY